MKIKKIYGEVMLINILLLCTLYKIIQDFSAMVYLSDMVYLLSLLVIMFYCVLTLILVHIGVIKGKPEDVFSQFLPMFLFIILLWFFKKLSEELTFDFTNEDKNKEE